MGRYYGDIDGKWWLEFVNNTPERFGSEHLTTYYINKRCEKR